MESVVTTACDTAPPLETALVSAVTGHGYAFVPASRMREMIGAAGSIYDWQAFADSWATLPVDDHMADQGRYRRRRHAVFTADKDGTILRCAHQAHFQTLDYNPLNGGVERWFEPIEQQWSDGASLRSILACCQHLFGRCNPGVRAWHIEVHQFRIEAAEGSAGLPTPEGMHRDGVDFVLVLLVRRCNIRSGTTLIGTASGGFFSSFTLTDPFDAALVDDHRVFHGVTPVEAMDPSQPAHRDVLVVTFRRNESA